MVFSSLAAIALIGKGVAAQDRPVWGPTLQRIVEQEASRQGFPSFAIVVVDREGTLTEVTVGHRSVAGGEAITPASLYRTGSVGKTLTDLAVLVGVEQDRLDLDADVRKYLPGFAPENPFGGTITLRQLMMHTAGLVREPPIGSYFDATSPTLAATVESLNETTLIWKPGSRTKYSNAGLAVVGRVLEVAYGTSYADVLRRLVFEPAGMRTARVGRTGGDPVRLVEGLMERPDGSTWPAPTFDLGMAPAGDLYASLHDMAAFMTSLLRQDGRVAAQASLRSMWTPSPPRDTWQWDVGLGFSLNGTFADRYRLARNGGAVYGFATELALLPEEGLGVYAVAAKDLANGTVQAIAQWALLAALAQQQGLPLPDYQPPPIPFETARSQIAACSTEPDDLPDSRVLGVYGGDHNPLIVCRKDGKLHAVVEWMFPYPLSTGPNGTYTFPSYALYGHESLRFEGDGPNPNVAILGVGADGVRFPRQRQ